MKQLLKDSFATAPTGSQSRIADALGVRATTVNKWANGGAVPPSQRWPMLEELLGLEPGSLAKARVRPPDDDKLDAILAAVVDIGQRLTEVEQYLRIGLPPLSIPTEQSKTASPPAPAP
jgi:DNA-binding transcriptional regulator YdaS (Cro superfamily)